MSLLVIRELAFQNSVINSSEVLRLHVTVNAISCKACAYHSLNIISNSLLHLCRFSTFCPPMQCKCAASVFVQCV